MEIVTLQSESNSSVLMETHKVMAIFVFIPIRPRWVTQHLFKRPLKHRQLLLPLIPPNRIIYNKDAINVKAYKLPNILAHATRFRKPLCINSNKHGPITIIMLRDVIFHFVSPNHSQHDLIYSSQQLITIDRHIDMQFSNE